jgi:hypothetical protein
MRLNALSNMIALVAALEVAVFLGLWLYGGRDSYRRQRDWACMFGTDEPTPRTCW